MLKVYYESGNDTVAKSTKGIEPYVNQVLNDYKSGLIEKVVISQADVLNCLGIKICEEIITCDEVKVIIEELGEVLTFNEEGHIDWYTNVPDWTY